MLLRFFKTNHFYITKVQFEVYKKVKTNTLTLILNKSFYFFCRLRVEVGDSKFEDFVGLLPSDGNNDFVSDNYFNVLCPVSD